MGRAAHLAEVESLWIAFACEMDSTIGSVVSGWAAEASFLAFRGIVSHRSYRPPLDSKELQAAIPVQRFGGVLMSSPKLDTYCQAPWR